VVFGAQVGVVCGVSFVDCLGHPQENQDDKDTVEDCGDSVGPVPTKILESISWSASTGIVTTNLYDVSRYAAATAYTETQTKPPKGQP